MHTTTHPARRRRHLSRHERQRLARAAAFSRRTPAIPPAVAPAKLGANELELIDRLVRHDRTAVSSALLAIAGIGAGHALRLAVLALVGENIGLGNFEPAALGWNGTRWSIQPTPNPDVDFQTFISVNSVSCVSRRACTSVGSFSNNFRGLTFAQHWNGLRWSDQRTPRLGHALNGVSCTSATVCFAVGSGPRGPLAERFTGPNRKRSGGGLG